MQTDTGKISLIQIEADGNRTAQVDCDPKLLPKGGQYLWAHNPNESDAVLGCSLFPMGLPTSMESASNPGLTSLGPIPRTWHPGTMLALRGPLGRGFNLPPAVRSLGLIALGETVGRLLPLIPSALAQNADIAVFSDAPLPSLPPAIEIRSVQAIPEAVAWADFLAIDLPLENIPQLRQALQLGTHDYVPCPTQVLVTTPMPCAGIGECAVCAVPKRKRGYKLACKDGPVVNLNQLAW
jgi:dihydroorotate dehydrogenase electron transfer subunit